MNIRISLSVVACGALLATAPAFPFCFEEAAREYSLNPRLLESIAKTESGMNPRAVGTNRNGSHDYGLMQINSFWVGKRGLTVEALLGDACFNTRTGASILRDCIDRNGNTWKAVGCYNATSNNKRAKYAWKVYRNLAKNASGAEKVAAASLALEKKSAPMSANDSAELRIAVTDLYAPESGGSFTGSSSPSPQTGKP